YLLTVLVSGPLSAVCSTLSLHDALPISALLALFVAWQYRRESGAIPRWASVVLAVLRLTAFAGAIVFFLAPMKRTDQEIVTESRDRKSTRLNSSHVKISYAVFCLKKKKS